MGLCAPVSRSPASRYRRYRKYVLNMCLTTYILQVACIFALPPRSPPKYTSSYAVLCTTAPCPVVLSRDRRGMNRQQLDSTFKKGIPRLRLRICASQFVALPTHVLRQFTQKTRTLSYTRSRVFIPQKCALVGTRLLLFLDGVMSGHVCFVA